MAVDTVIGGLAIKRTDLERLPKNCNECPYSTQEGPSSCKIARGNLCPLQEVEE